MFEVGQILYHPDEGLLVITGLRRDGSGNFVSYEHLYKLFAFEHGDMNYFHNTSPFAQQVLYLGTELTPMMKILYV